MVLWMISDYTPRALLPVDLIKHRPGSVNHRIDLELSSDSRRV